MGLDMYLMGEKFFWSYPEIIRREDGLRVQTLVVELGYWRKHPNLHGFIVNTFAGGLDECQRISLDDKKLGEIIQAVKARELPHTTGFFFGTSDDSSESIENDVKILMAAREWLKTEEPNVSREVYYEASW